MCWITNMSKSNLVLQYKTKYYGYWHWKWDWISSFHRRGTWWVSKEMWNAYDTYLNPCSKIVFCPKSFENALFYSDPLALSEKLKLSRQYSYSLPVESGSEVGCCRQYCTKCPRQPPSMETYPVKNTITAALFQPLLGRVSLKTWNIGGNLGIN